MTLGERLRKLRENRGLKQNEAAVALKLSNVNLNRYETDKHEPDLDTLKLLATFYAVSTDYLLGKVANPHDELVPEKKQTPADTAGENIGLPAELHQRVISALDNMDPERADEIVQRIESAAALFPKETKDAPAKKMA